MIRGNINRIIERGVIMRILECSSKGDKRFSAFYAKIEWNGQMISIENIYQSVKRNSEGEPCKKGEPVEFLIINNEEFEPKYLTPFYNWLWITYLDSHPDLVKIASTYDDYNDMFKGKSINCQADVIRQYIKQGKNSFIDDMYIELDNFLNDKESVVNMFKVIVAGSRGFNDYEYLCECLDEQILNMTEQNDIIDEIQIVSGGAKGADKLGEKYAKERGYSLKVFPANWNKFGKSAGYRRNEEMAEYADACICFWDKESKGTKHMIDLAKKHKLITLVNEVSNEEVKNNYNNKNMEGTNMENKTMKNNNVVNYTLVGRNGKALLLNNTTNKYSTLEDKNGSTTMACIKMLANLVEKFEQTEDTLNIVFLPRNLGGILRVNAVDEWIANGNKTTNGTQLSKEYVEFAKYISDMRVWLETNNLIFKIQGGDLVRNNEKKMIDTAWRQLDKITKKTKAPEYTRPASKGAKPVVPNSVKNIAVDDLDM
jgi:hypothetical protein